MYKKVSLFIFDEFTFHIISCNSRILQSMLADCATWLKIKQKRTCIFILINQLSYSYSRNCHVSEKIRCVNLSPIKKMERSTVEFLRLQRISKFKKLFLFLEFFFLALLFPIRLIGLLFIILFNLTFYKCSLSNWLQSLFACGGEEKMFFVWVLGFYRF